MLKELSFKKKQLFVDFGIIGANTFWYSVFFLLKLRYCIAWGNSEKFFAHAMYTTTNRCAIHKRQFSQHLGVQSCICIVKSSFVKVISIVVNSFRGKGCFRYALKSSAKLDAALLYNFSLVYGSRLHSKSCSFSLFFDWLKVWSSLFSWQVWFFKNTMTQCDNQNDSKSFTVNAFDNNYHQWFETKIVFWGEFSWKSNAFCVCILI